MHPTTANYLSMCNFFLRRLWGKTALILLYILLCGVSPLMAQDLRVLVLHSYQQEYPWTRSQNDGFVEQLTARVSERNLLFSSECLDTKRVDFFVPYRQFFAEYLVRKYRDYRFDLIYSTDDNALQFLLEYKQELFPGVPVVFSGVNSLAVESRLDRDEYTGVYEVKEISHNVELIRRLLPLQESILVVGDGSETDQAIRAELQDLSTTPGGEQGDIRLEHIADNRLQDLTARLAARERGMILLTTIGGVKDDNGQLLALDHILRGIVNAGDFVILSMEDAYMAEGVLGGVVTSGVAQGRAAADLAARLVADGVAVSSLAPSVGPNVPTFDHRELQRLNIPRLQLPEGSVILNAPRSIYQEFKRTVWMTALVFVILLLLIAVLVVSMMKLTRAEEALAESERFLNSVIENIPDMVFVKRADTLRFVRLNRSGERFLGVRSEDIVGRTAEEVFSAEQAADFTRQDKETLAGGSLLDIPEEMVTGPGGIHFLHTKKIPILDENGHPAFLLGISRDMTREREERERRLALEERLIQAEKMESIGTLAGGIAHDFNNILSSVIGYTELARIERDQDKVDKYLEGTLKGAERAKELIRQILTFSRKTDHKKSPVDLSQVVRETMKMLRSTLPSTITMEEDLLKEAVIFGDATQVQQIVFNLCTNAYHAMMTKGGVLAVSTQQVCIQDEQEQELLRLAPGEYLRLVVADTGMGMDAETRQKMFDPYFTTKGPEAGTGLGLAVVHGIVKSHQGQIHVYSEHGVGTTIHVYFPRLEAESAVIEQEELKPMTGRGEHILLVDDEEDIINVHQQLLENSGYQVTSFTDGRQALQAIREQPARFNALVTDMTMPHLTGAELARTALTIVPGLPIILCTGHSAMINREKALAMGIGAYCEKPLRRDELLGQLQQLLRMRSADAP